MIKNLGKQKRAYVEYMLKTKHLRVDFENLVTWASGIKSPIYVDNRGSLASYDIRYGIYEYMADYIRDNAIKCDAIVAAPTAGLHIGASVAKILGVPFVIITDGMPKFLNPMPIVWSGSNHDLIVGTNPESIPWGIWFANELKLPFAYVRPPKRHGLKNSVEGFVKTEQDQFAMFLHYYVDTNYDKYLSGAVDIMKKLGVKFGEVRSQYCEAYTEDIDLSDKNVVVVEDLFSTSQSAVDNVNEVRKSGGIVEYIMAIFDYELDLSNDIIREAKVQKTSFITAKEFLDIAQNLDPEIKKKRSEIDVFLSDPIGFTKENLRSTRK